MYIIDYTSEPGTEFRPSVETSSRNVSAGVVGDDEFLMYSRLRR